MPRQAVFLVVWCLAAVPGAILEAFGGDLSQPRGEAPLEVTGSRMPDGIRLVCRHPHYPFTLELRGKEIVPLSSDRLLWRIDGRNIELLVARQGHWLPPSASDLEILLEYRAGPAGLRQPETNRAAEESALSPSGKPVLVWREGASPGISRILAAARSGSYIVVLATDQVSPESEQEVREYLKKTLFTLGSVAEAKIQERDPDPLQTGMPLQGQIRLQEALWGEPYAALLNSKLATSADRAVGGTVLAPSALIELTRLILAADEKRVTVQVFDGRVAHAINLVRFESAGSIFHYWDPWGQGSFLEKANNAAGVDARPHPTEGRIWLITYDELESILYSVVAPERDIIAALRTCTLLAGPAPEAIRVYRALHSQDDSNPEIASERLANLTQHFLEDGDTRSSITLLAVQWALRPPSPETMRQAFVPYEAVGERDAEKRARELIAVAAEIPVPRTVPTRLRLAEAKETDFFEFFSLSETSSEVEPDGRHVHRFRPSAPKFRELVELKLTAEREETIVAHELSVAREFVDHPIDGFFARDFVQSFLLFSVSASDVGYVQSLINEIWKPSRAEVAIPSTRRPGTRVPAMPSIAYMTYLGVNPEFTQTLPSVKLTLRNVGSAGSRALLLSVIDR